VIGVPTKRKARLEKSRAESMRHWTGEELNLIVNTLHHQMGQQHQKSGKEWVVGRGKGNK